LQFKQELLDTNDSKQYHFLHEPTRTSQGNPHRASSWCHPLAGHYSDHTEGVPMTRGKISPAERSAEGLQIMHSRVAMFNELCRDPEVSEALSSTPAGTARKKMFQRLIVNPLNEKHPVPESALIPPNKDPEVPHPGMVFSEGQWRNPDAVALRKERKAATHRIWLATHRDQANATRRARRRNDA
jgi:hypothetical protein